jgi:RND family efflux transporter MFP subunit
MTSTTLDQERRRRLESISRPAALHDAAPRRYVWLRPALGATGMAIVVGVACYTLGQRSASSHETGQVVTHAVAAPVVRAADPRPVPATLSLEATGFVTARRQSAVSAQITAQLAQLLVEEGQHVEKGQVIARLASDDYRASLNAMVAAVDADRAKVVQDRYARELAAKNVERYTPLVKTRVISESQYDTLVATANEAVATQQTDEMAVRADQARAEQARVQFGFAEVRAPFSGIIISQDAQVGDIISPQGSNGSSTRTSVVTMVDMGSLEIDADINESFIDRVRIGSKARVRLDAYPDWAIASSVLAVIPSADRSRATIRVRLSLQKDPRIVPNMAARISFEG